MRIDTVMEFAVGVDNQTNQNEVLQKVDSDQAGRQSYEGDPNPLVIYILYVGEVSDKGREHNLTGNKQYEYHYPN